MITIEEIKQTLMFYQGINIDLWLDGKWVLFNTCRELGIRRAGIIIYNNNCKDNYGVSYDPQTNRQGSGA